MAYTFNTNQVTAQARGTFWLYNLKEAMKTAGWTVVASGDGDSNFAVGSDVITDSTDAAGPNRFNNTRAWICLQQPSGGSGNYAGTRQIVFQRGDTGDGGNNQEGRFVYSVGGTANTGAIDENTAPTFSDEHVWCGGGTPAAPTFDQYLNFPGGPNCVYSVAVGGAAENFSFVAYVWPVNPGTALMSQIHFDACREPLPGDTDPFVLGFAFNPTMDSTTPFTTDGVWAQGNMGSGMVQMSVLPDSFGAGSYGYPTNARTGKDDLYSLFYARRGVGGGYKGKSTVYRRANPVRTGKSTYTVNTTGDRIRLGTTEVAVIVPWDNATPG